MRIVLLTGLAAALVASPFVADASPKYAAPINVAKNTTLKVRAAGTAPTPITETQYWATGDIDGDGVAEAGTLRVACRDKAVAFASFQHVGGGLSSGKRSETNLMLSKSADWDKATVQWHRSPDKTMGADSWHTVTITGSAQQFCP